MGMNQSFNNSTLNKSRALQSNSNNVYIDPKHQTPPTSSHHRRQMQDANHHHHHKCQLDIYPWFRRHLSREEATRIILKDGNESHGLYLVRPSETQPGEYVLTFNCYGNAKHLRLSITSDNKCIVKHMTFQSIIHMLEHFKQNSIPFSGRALTQMNGARRHQRGVLLTPIKLVDNNKQQQQIQTSRIKIYQTQKASDAD